LAFGHYRLAGMIIDIWSYHELRGTHAPLRACVSVAFHFSHLHAT
jgi:hypothetical protein